MIARHETTAPKVGRAPKARVRRSEMDRLLAAPGVTLLCSRDERQDLGPRGPHWQEDAGKRLIIVRRIVLVRCDDPRGVRRTCWIKAATVLQYEGISLRAAPGKIEEYESFWSVEHATAAWPYGVHVDVSDGLAIPACLRDVEEYR